MSFRLRIDTTNAAFADPFGEDDDSHLRAELVSMLEDITQNIASGCTLDKAQSIRDANGNRVGQFKIHNDE